VPNVVVVVLIFVFVLASMLAAWLRGYRDGKAVARAVHEFELDRALALERRHQGESLLHLGRALRRAHLGDAATAVRTWPHRIDRKPELLHHLEILGLSDLTMLTTPELGADDSPAPTPDRTSAAAAPESPPLVASEDRDDTVESYRMEGIL